MQKFEGIHFYVNVANFNEVVIDEESKNGKVNHSIHALDTFFSGIESFGKKNFPEKYVIEKITGASSPFRVYGRSVPYNSFLLYRSSDPWKQDPVHLILLWIHLLYCL